MISQKKTLFSALYFWFVSGILLRKKIKLIRQSGVFDEQSYLEQNPEVKLAAIDPIIHYLLYGRLQHRNPGKYFNLCFHVDHQPDSKHGISALTPWFFNNHNVFHEKPFDESLRVLNQQKIKPDALVSRIIEPADYARQYSSPDSHPEFEKEQLCFSGEINPKPIAFYLPQFHPFEENDRFWGKGFTEWTNVTKALPVYKGHHQPKLPGELGFYDLRLKPVIERQIELAKKSGIFGFCFHHYFLESKPVMRKPFDLFFRNPDLDFPFCLHWANEPWTVRWDGNRNRDGILIDQVHDDEENMAFINDIAPILRDKRYICIEKRPVLLIYRPALFPDFKRTAGMWKNFCRQNGIEEPYLVMTKTLFDADKTPEHYGMDAAVEFPPHLVPRISLIDDVTLHHPGFTGSVYSYQAVMDHSINLQKPPYTLFRGIMPQWDNTARNRSATIYHGSNPFLYQKWMTALGKYTLENLPADRQFIFINAWNEWAEGAYLEPDRKQGYAWLNATTKAMLTLRHE